MKYDTLLEYHMDHDHRVTTDGSGHSWVVVQSGCNLGGHLETVIRCAKAPGWGVVHLEATGETLIPTYAYDRVVVAGLRLSLASVGMREAGRSGGSAKSEAKARSSAENGKKGGRPKKTEE